MRRAKKVQKRNTKKAKRVRQAQRGKRSRRRTLQWAIRVLMPDVIFAGLSTHGNAQWSLGVLSFVALFWAFSGETTLAERYTLASEIATHWFPGEFLATSYRGFMNALVRHNATLVKVLSERLRARMLELDDERGKIAGLTPFVADGSQVAAPWTKANEEKLGKKGRKPKGAKCQKKETDLRPRPAPATTRANTANLAIKAIEGCRIRRSFWSLAFPKKLDLGLRVPQTQQ